MHHSFRPSGSAQAGRKLAMTKLFCTPHDEEFVAQDGFKLLIACTAQRQP